MGTWQQRLQDCGIVSLGVAPRLPEEPDLAAAEKRLKVRLPDSYRTFCTEIGPGRFGDFLEIFSPWRFKGTFVPQNIASRLSPHVDATGRPPRDLGKTAIHFGYLVWGAPPVPRVISNQSAEVFFLPGEPTEPDELVIYALDRRVRSGAPLRLVKLARTFPQLIAEGFAGKKLQRLPFVSAPTADQLALEFRPRELPSA
jgi:hypothetical protein